MADRDQPAVLVPVRDQHADRLAQRLRHVGGRVAVADFDVELDATDHTTRRRQRAGGECQNSGRADRVDGKRTDIDRLRRAIELDDARRDQRAERRWHHRDAAARRPRVARDPPSLRDQRAAGLRLDMDARAGDQRGDGVVIVGVLDAQIGFGLGKRDRLDGGAIEEDGGHGNCSEMWPRAVEQNGGQTVDLI